MVEDSRKDPLRQDTCAEWMVIAADSLHILELSFWFSWLFGSKLVPDFPLRCQLGPHPRPIIGLIHIIFLSQTLWLKRIGLSRIIN